MNGNIETAFIGRVGTDPEQRTSQAGNPRLARGNNMIAAATTPAVAPAALCVQCNERPRLAALDRCKECIRAAAAQDRDTRTAAETRVSLKAQRQAALERLGDLYLEFAASTEGMRFLEAQQAELVGPRNDPEYLKTVIARDKEREVAANAITTVHHMVEWGRNYVALTLADDRDHAKAKEVSAILQHLFEAEHRYHDDPHDQTKAPDQPQKHAPKHGPGREKRSRSRGKAK